ncbi:Scr1 family TA system antitoxin-like transcriptional regulator [Streptomyces sp. NBC_00847]|uniref:Scr1 family TA system antitoxin-like transcriptional regulator n=1 Tax=Streptomyces sp. NBC_00847 TaxID=2975850 RepID=UPI00224D8059|nr:Scr1 family TA system antitoxin-like transcriptional regulator [Streptomyces sp. NBC_00847]MCX4882707.1 helix-turn-helix domain-containing protein [Streptomyces sp. NBC_00847]
MSRWRALPAELDSPVRQLVVRLRRLKDHSGLSLRQLAARTGYSPKSWERYLGARSLPPREAVEALARIGGEDPTRLLALQEVAAEAWGRGRNTAAVAEVALVERELLPTDPGEQVRVPTRALRVALVAGTVTLDGPFTLLETPDHHLLAYTEGPRGSQWVAHPDEVSILARKYAMLRSQAMTPQESKCLLDRLPGVK